eukprot:SAG31_NODE_46410_length_254_cov_1.316129_1_plen_37_part_01
MPCAIGDRIYGPDISTLIPEMNKKFLEENSRQFADLL